MLVEVNMLLFSILLISELILITHLLRLKLVLELLVLKNYFVSSQLQNTDLLKIKLKLVRV